MAKRTSNDAMINKAYMETIKSMIRQGGDEQQKAYRDFWNRNKAQNQVDYLANRENGFYGMDEFAPLYSKDVTQEIRSAAYVGMCESLDRFSVDKAVNAQQDGKFKKKEEKSSQRTLCSYIFHDMTHTAIQWLVAQSKRYYPQSTDYYAAVLVQTKKAGVKDIQATPSSRVLQMLANSNSYLTRGKGQISETTIDRVKKIYHPSHIAPKPTKRELEKHDIASSNFSGDPQSMLDDAQMSEENITNIAKTLFFGREYDFFDFWFSAAFHDGKTPNCNEFPAEFADDFNQNDIKRQRIMLGNKLADIGIVSSEKAKTFEKKWKSLAKKSVPKTAENQKNTDLRLVAEPAASYHV